MTNTLDRPGPLGTRLIGFGSAFGACTGAVYGAGWIVTLAAILLVAPAGPSGRDADDPLKAVLEFILVAAVAMVVGAVIGTMIGFVSGTFAGVADWLGSPRLRTSLRWVPAVVGALISTALPWWLVLGFDAGRLPFEIAAPTALTTVVYVGGFGAAVARWTRAPSSAGASSSVSA